LWLRSEQSVTRAEVAREAIRVVVETTEEVEVDGEES
jgi:hypothetical protein